MPHRTMPHIYIAGPYSSPYPIYNMRAALEAADQLIASGVGFPVVPHLTGFWDFAFPRPYKQWLELDLEALRGCNAVWRIGGKSSGADSEVSEAKKLGMPVFLDLEDVVQYCKGWQKDA